ncbi:MAG: hypothetical protein RI918_2397, partial [Pseudomonadota bacterium]
MAREADSYPIQKLLLFGGDEGRDRVQQPQHGLEHADQRAARGTLLRLVAGL